MKMKLIIFGNFSQRLVRNPGKISESVRSLLDRFQIQIDPVSSSATISYKQFGRRMGCPVGHGRGGRVHNLNATINCEKRSVWRQSRKAMGMQLQFKVPDDPFNCRYQSECPVGTKQSTGILDIHSVNPEFYQLFCLVRVELIGMNRTLGEYNPTNRVQSNLFGRTYRNFQVSNVIDCIVGCVIPHPVRGKSLG